MSIDITFTLSEDDLSRFRDIAERAKNEYSSADEAKKIVDAARKLAESPELGELPDFMRERLERVGILVDMLEDKEWNLEGEDRQRVLGGLAYFAHPDDLIPDDVPGLGFLDDAIYMEIVIRNTRPEIDAYELFCEFRSAEEERRKKQGIDDPVSKQEWIKDQRAVLQSRMRTRRRRFRAF